MRIADFPIRNPQSAIRNRPSQGLPEGGPVVRGGGRGREDRRRAWCGLVGRVGNFVGAGDVGGTGLAGEQPGEEGLAGAGGTMEVGGQATLEVGAQVVEEGAAA